MYKSILKKSPEVSEIMNILSHEKRLSMACILANWEKNIWELTTALNISQSLASQFALKMKTQWLLKSKKDWKEVFYSIKDKKTIKLITALKNIYC
jgi:DNA-binding transcriptional ArsR family regulator